MTRDDVLALMVDNAACLRQYDFISGTTWPYGDELNEENLYFALNQGTDVAWFARRALPLADWKACLAAISVARMGLRRRLHLAWADLENATAETREARLEDYRLLRLEYEAAGQELVCDAILEWVAS